MYHLVVLHCVLFKDIVSKQTSGCHANQMENLKKKRIKFRNNVPGVIR